MVSGYRGCLWMVGALPPEVCSRVQGQDRLDKARVDDAVKSAEGNRTKLKKNA